MTDLEIKRLCAKAMGIKVLKGEDSWWIKPKENGEEYDPLHDDAQAMALVKKFKLELRFSDDFWSNSNWSCIADNSTSAYDPDLNRAICECVAKMEANKRFGQPHYGHERNPDV